MSAYRHRPKGMTDLESTLVKNHDVTYDERWHPTLVDTFVRELSKGALKEMDPALRKNIAYTLQYLQFLQLEIGEIHWHSVLITQVYKTYIVTAMGIIEGIFDHLVRANGFQKKIEWEEIDSTTRSFPKSRDIKEDHIVVTMKKLDPPRDDMMKFAYLIRKVKDKKLVDLPGSAVADMMALRELRNKVHLHVMRYKNDTDYMGINDADYYLARYFLYAILTDASFEPRKPSPFAFIRLPKEAEAAVKERFEKKDGE